MFIVLGDEVVSGGMLRASVTGGRVKDTVVTTVAKRWSVVVLSTVVFADADAVTVKVWCVTKDSVTASTTVPVAMESDEALMSEFSKVAPVIVAFCGIEGGAEVRIIVLAASAETEKREASVDICDTLDAVLDIDVLSSDGALWLTRLKLYMVELVPLVRPSESVSGLSPGIVLGSVGKTLSDPMIAVEIDGMMAVTASSP